MIGQNSIQVEALTKLKQYVESEITGKLVEVLQDTEKEFMDIDFDNMKIGNICIVKYDDELQAVQRISEDEIAFYNIEQ